MPSARPGESYTKTPFGLSLLGPRVADGRPWLFIFEPRVIISAFAAACLFNIAHFLNFLLLETPRLDLKGEQFCKDLGVSVAL